MNIGLYKETWLNESIYLSRTYGLINKEHNGDYLKTDLIHKKFDHGLDTINIAPEFGQMQTKIYWNNLNSKERSKFYKLCLDSGRWKKWVDEDFDYETEVEALINICGHYVFSHPKFEMIKPEGLEQEINTAVSERISEILR